jgi:predicted O-linked N-acetylglucosamine transferase (SPINDLY family)
VPQSRLLLKYRGLDDESVRGRYLGLFAAHGVDPRRLDFAPRSDHAEYLAAYRQVDIALDPFPFGGGVTTCDALWMGVPVVTCPGETFASRHSLSHLANAGLSETVARDLDEYVGLAMSLAGDWPRLAALRAGLRRRMAASPLCDGKRFAANLLTLLRDIWQQWIVQGQSLTKRDL